LRGSEAEKVLKFDLDQIKTYGLMAQMKEKRVREIVNYLVLNEYLALTNSEFPVVKLTPKARDMLLNGENLTMKIAKEDKREIKPAKPKAAVNNDLFNVLRELRYSLAQEKKVPAFVIFSDATLMDMCSKMPANDLEFLEVSGVGKMKLKEYGKEFLEAINNFT
jgi:ATP-dependent DNA helicase RecQ